MPDDQDREVRDQREQHPGDRDEARERRDRAPPEAVGQPAEQDRAHRADGVHEIHQAGGGQPQVERFAGEPEPDDVEHGDESAHGAAADDVEQDEGSVGEGLATHMEQLADIVGSRDETASTPAAAPARRRPRRAPARRRPPCPTASPRCRSRSPRAAGRPCRRAPSPDVQAGGAGVGRRVQLLTQVCRRHRRQTGQDDALKQPQRQQRGPPRRHGAGDGDDGGRPEGHVDEPRPADDVGQGSGDEQGDAQAQGRQRQAQGGARRRDVELGRELGQEALRAVQHGEGGQPRHEQGDQDAPVLRGAWSIPRRRRGLRCPGHGTIVPCPPPRGAPTPNGICRDG